MIWTKFCRTFVAMVWGWLACSLFALCLAGLIQWLEGNPLFSIWGAALFFMFWCGLVILVAWLFIFFPVDCLVPESSCLRRPRHAAVLGAICGALPFVLLGTWSQMTDWATWWRAMVQGAQDLSAWLYVGGAAITGLTAAWHVVSKHPRTPQQNPR